MIKILLCALGTTLLFSGCFQKAENPDEGFDDFYQGSPGTFEPDVQKRKSESENTTESFEFTGGNNQWQCTVSCDPK